MRILLQLFVVHPSLSPEQIGNELGLQARFQQHVGEKHQTLRGDTLPGRYADSRWRYVEQHSSQTGHFAEEMRRFVGMLENRRDAILRLIGSGATVTVILALLGDGAYGDSLSPDLLRRLADCGVDFGIEAYDTPQGT